MYVITTNTFNFLPNQLFEIGRRDNNTKRSFLFVSKLLGKHLPVRPEVVRASGYLLSSLKYDFDNTDYLSCIKHNTIPSYENHAIDTDILVIGFCETATALGMSVAMSIEGSTFIATTREPLYGLKQLVTFEESHSHASTHYLYSDNIHLSTFRKLILVDDEITTGNSLLHLIEAMLNISDIKEITILTLLDWRSDEQRNKFETFSRQHNITLLVHALVCGTITEEDNSVYHNVNICKTEGEMRTTRLGLFPTKVIETPDGKRYRYLTDTGRFGMSHAQLHLIESRARLAAQTISNSLGSSKRLLVLGHGENIYIPSRVAAQLSELGYDVLFKTTSRTPIFCDEELFKDVSAFNDKGANYHFYNKQEAESFDRVILLSEDEFSHKLCRNMLVFKL